MPQMELEVLFAGVGPQQLFLHYATDARMVVVDAQLFLKRLEHVVEIVQDVSIEPHVREHDQQFHGHEVVAMDVRWLRTFV